MTSQKKKAASEQLELAEQRWNELEAQLDKEMLVFGPSRLEVGRILYEMKLLLMKYGLNKGRRGRWQPMLDKHKIDRKSAENWIRLYQEKADIPVNKMVVAAKKSQPDRKKNTVKATGLDPDPWIEPANENMADGFSKDEPATRRLTIECCFVLTLEQKRLFMDAVKKLGPLKATQCMYQAVVEEGT